MTPSLNMTGTRLDDLEPNLKTLVRPYFFRPIPIEIIPEKGAHMTGTPENPNPKTGAERVAQGATKVTAGAETVAQEGLRISGFPPPKPPPKAAASGG